TDTRNEKIGFKIREAQVRKIPYMLVLGDKEAEQGIVTVRKRSVGDMGATDLNSFITQITKEKNTRAY
ncbi:MAG TPA: threonine--tRNA ligase, partial [Papillibacter sp.]|nr:threonine--tRNA ligase [Papillibacter sp.]